MKLCFFGKTDSPIYERSEFIIITYHIEMWVFYHVWIYPKLFIFGKEGPYVAFSTTLLAFQVHYFMFHSAYDDQLYVSI